MTVTSSCSLKQPRRALTRFALTLPDGTDWRPACDSLRVLAPAERNYSAIAAFGRMKRRPTRMCGISPRRRALRVDLSLKPISAASAATDRYVLRSTLSGSRSFLRSRSPNTARRAATSAILTDISSRSDRAPTSRTADVRTQSERIGVTSQNAAKIHLMPFSGQNHFAREPFPRDSQVRPAIDLAMG
jgi:hypothetical protein